MVVYVLHDLNHIALSILEDYVKSAVSLNIMRKRKKSDSDVRIKPLHPQNNLQKQCETQNRHQKLRLLNDYGPI